MRAQNQPNHEKNKTRIQQQQIILYQTGHTVQSKAEELGKTKSCAFVRAVI